MRRPPRLVTRPHQAAGEHNSREMTWDRAFLPRGDGLLPLRNCRFITIQFGEGEHLNISAALIERTFGIPLVQWILDGLESGQIVTGPTGLCSPDGDAFGLFFELQCALLTRLGMLEE